MNAPRPEAAPQDEQTRQNARMLDCLREIRDAHPTCGEESQSAWSNRVWCGEYRDLQRKARLVLRELGYDL